LADRERSHETPSVCVALMVESLGLGMVAHSCRGRGGPLMIVRWGGRCG
jgi:hypothetical protein